MSKYTAAQLAARAMALALVGLLVAGSAPRVGADHGRQGVPGQTDAEVVVYGATPSGVTAAIAAARAGAHVTLIEPT